MLEVLLLQILLTCFIDDKPVNPLPRDNLIKKVLIIAIPTYTMALLTKSMVYTMPMLAITTVIATNLFDDTKENENRVDEGDGLDGGDVGDLDG